MTRDPFKARTPVPSASEIAKLLKRRAPEPPTIQLNPKEQAALHAYRLARAAWKQRQRDADWWNDPYTQTWMP